MNLYVLFQATKYTMEQQTSDQQHLKQSKGIRGQGYVPLLGLALLGILAIVVLSGAGFNARPVNADNRNQRNQPGVQPSAASSGQVQDVYIRALGGVSYDKPYVAVKANEPVRLHFSADSNAGCGKVLIMRDFGVSLVSSNGEEQVAEFTPSPGRYTYSCSMGMFRGVLEAQ